MKSFIDYANEFEQKNSRNYITPKISDYFNKLKDQLVLVNSTDNTLNEFNTKMKSLISNWEPIQFRDLSITLCNVGNRKYLLNSRDNFKTFRIVLNTEYMPSNNGTILLNSSHIDYHLKGWDLKDLINLYKFIQKEERDIHKEILKLQEQNMEMTKKEIEKVLSKISL